MAICRGTCFALRCRPLCLLTYIALELFFYTHQRSKYFYPSQKPIPPLIPHKKTHPAVKILRLSLFKPLGCLPLKCLHGPPSSPLNAEARHLIASIGSISSRRAWPPPTMRSCFTQLCGTGREGVIMRENVPSHV